MIQAGSAGMWGMRVHYRSSQYPHACGKGPSWPCATLIRYLLGHHHLHKLLIVDLAIAVHICLSDHLVNLLVGGVSCLQAEHLLEPV